MLTTLSPRAALEGLAPLSEQDLTHVLSRAYEVTVPEGWAPMWEGTAADKVYLILDGEVAVRRNGEDIARLGAGDLVGETAINRRRLRNATVVARSTLRVLVFPAPAWREVLAATPALAAAVDGIAAARD